MTEVTPLTQSSTDDLRASLKELALDHSGLEKIEDELSQVNL
jgi:hypothetical protein